MIWIGLLVSTGRKLANPTPVQLVMALGFVICVGFRYNVVFPAQVKDQICVKLLGRASALSVRSKYSHVEQYFGVAAVAPVLLILTTNLFPELCYILSTLGFILHAAFNELFDHMENVEARMRRSQ
ncbi:unnamed protein product [Aphanomyces euteiches]